MLRQSGSDYLENGGTSCASLQDQVPPTDKSDRKMQEGKSSGLLKILILSLVAVQEHGHDVPICSQHSALPFVFFSTDASSGPNNNPNLPNAQCLAFTCRMLTQIYLQFCIVIYCCWQSIHHGPEFMSK
jgi:hypothetical protein